MMQDRSIGDATPRKFMINLHLEAEREPEVRSCEIIGSRFRNRTSFGRGVTIEDVFVAPIAEGLRACLRDREDPIQILSLPDFVIEAPGITLSGAQIVATQNGGQVCNILFRFRFFLGGVNNAFQRDVGFGHSLADDSERISALVLSDLSLPILNICDAARVGLFQDSRPIATFGSKLADRAHELAFQIEMIKRFAQKPDPTHNSRSVTRTNARKIEKAHADGILTPVRIGDR
ncbi:hypothetical protein [Yoonia sp. SS1-5]|uniref:Uncharacterized protein n=1 Tax=Yoonia rhodophyticola TaxID=3137370 RepID=A0AAN0NHI4_9RHOB